jgi:hypothetical protein
LTNPVENAIGNTFVLSGSGTCSSHAYSSHGAIETVSGETAVFRATSETELLQMVLPLLQPAPVTVHNEHGRSPFLIVADHAGNSMPRALGRLGVSETECERHIAWDIGIAAVCRLVADALDATLIQQIYSRLVIDCNRPPSSETSIPETGEFTRVPGNIGLSKSRKATRVREIFRPYHDRIEAARPEAKSRATDRADRDAQLHACLQGRCAALACWRALQSRCALRPSPHGAAETRRGARRRQQRALQRERCVGLHHPGTRGATRPTSRCDRSSQ